MFARSGEVERKETREYCARISAAGAVVAVGRIESPDPLNIPWSVKD